MESAGELREKLTVYFGQLEQVEQLLEIDATNAQFLDLKMDLEKVISLTETLLAQVSAQESTTHKPANNNSSDSQKDSGSYSPGQADYNSDKDELVNNIVDNVTKEQSVTLSKPFKVGDRIEVLGGARVFSGVVTSLVNDNECNIRYYEFPDSEVKLPFSSLQAIPGGLYKGEQVQIGLQCQCKFAADLRFYNVTVTGITPYGYSVTYSEYGNVEEVPLEYLRPIPSLAQPNPSEATSSSASLGKDAKKDTLALIAIPENLQVLPTDTEEEKRRKYKKLKAIKNKNHQIQQELQVKEVQQSWQKFVQKGTKRPLSGIGNKNSIFSTSGDTSSKIGVANSGRGMTQNFERKRFKFDGPTEQDNDEDHS
jgi:survival-of-motor-neuron-related-splicing factor 30